MHEGFDRPQPCSLPQLGLLLKLTCFKSEQFYFLRVLTQYYSFKAKTHLFNSNSKENQAKWVVCTILGNTFYSLLTSNWDKTRKQPSLAHAEHTHTRRDSLRLSISLAILSCSLLRYLKTKMHLYWSSSVLQLTNKAPDN